MKISIMKKKMVVVADKATKDNEFQFECNGDFVSDCEGYTAEKSVFNLPMGLRDSRGK